MNNPAKQADIICWHRDMNNLVFIVTETKLKDKVQPWIANKFASVCVFVSGLGSEYLGSGVAIIMDIALAKHVCKISEIPDYVLVSSGLVNVVVHHSIDDVGDFFDTDHSAVFISVGLGGLLDIQLSLLHKQANKDCWKFNVVNADKVKWCKFRDATAANATMLSDNFAMAKRFLDMNSMWNIIRKILVLLAGGTFKKKWFKDFDCVFTKVSSRFHKLELLVSKLVKASLIDRRMESFKLDKGCTIRSVLERPFQKVVLDHLVVDEELILEPKPVRSKVDEIMEGWTRKRAVVSDISDDWAQQYLPLSYVFDEAFSDVMGSIDFDEMFNVILNLPDSKTAGLFGISNELWKHCDKTVLDMFLVLLNFCLAHESVLGPWKETWVSIIPKP
ncbi:hypothetical protein G9A89_007630 [Geosiphon pyriformis]|nr:hypothetical protein G9A89_007630 [Geosiphon pyriformis]